MIYSGYNEIDPFAAQWIRNLIKAGHVALGVVDERSIRDLAPADVAGHGQRHFFAGIGAWSHALRLAGWPDDLDVWTGSCPCQPFSAAGKRKGFDDDRHLWPAWFGLIRECRPAIVFGEQVASHDGLKWLDAVHADLEGAGYAFGAADLCAAGVGAPHIRQRLYFVAITDGERLERVRVQLRERGPQPPLSASDRGGSVSELAESERERGGARWLGKAPGRSSIESDRYGHAIESDRYGHAVLVGDACGARSGRDTRSVFSTEGEGDRERCESRRVAYLTIPASVDGTTRGFWHPADWIACRDGKARPVEPGTFPLAHGAPSRVGRLRAYGNAIAPQVAATFIRAVMETL